MNEKQKIHHPIRHSILFALFFTIGFLIYLSFHPRVWYPLALTYINNDIFAEKGLTLEIGQLTGNANTGLSAINVRFFNSDSTIDISADSLNTHYGNIFDVIRRNISIIELVNPVFKIRPTRVQGHETSLPRTLPLFRSDKIILRHGSFLKMAEADTTEIEQIDLISSLHVVNDFSTMQLSQGSFFVKKQHIPVKNISGSIVLRDDLLTVQSMTFSTGEALYHIGGSITMNDTLTFETDGSIEGFSPLHWADIATFKSDDLYKIKTRISGNRFSQNATFSVVGDYQGVNNIQLNTDLTYSNDTLTIHTLQVANPANRFTIDGVVTRDLHYALSAAIDSLHLEPYFAIIKGAVVGKMFVSGQGSDQFETHFHLSADSVFGENIRMLRGAFSWQQRQITLTQTLEASTDFMNFYLSGSLDADSTLNLHLIGTGKAQSQFLAKYNIQADSMKITGDVTGRMTDPNISLEAMLVHSQISISHWDRLSGSMTVSELLGSRKGQLTLQAENGDIEGYQIQNLIAEAALSGNSIAIKSLQLSNDRDIFKLSGQIQNQNEVMVNDFFGQIGTNQISLTEPFELFILPSGAAITPVKIAINEGNLYGEISWTKQKQFDATLQIENLKPGTFLKNMSTANHMDANIRGIVHLAGKLSAPELQADLTISNGYYNTFKFQNIEMSANYHPAILTISKLRATITPSEYIHLTGMLPMRLDITNDPFIYIQEGDSLQLTMDAQEFDITQIPALKMLPIGLKGRVNSVANINGSYGHPRIEATASVSNVNIHELKFARVLGKIYYANEQIQFNDVVIKDQDLNYRGSGFLPVDLSFLPRKERFFNDRSLLLILSGDDKGLNYLAPYLPMTESLTGDFHTEFEMTGTFSKLIRNGEVMIRNGKVVIEEVDQPIEQLSGLCTLSNNMLSLECSGLLAEKKVTWAKELGLQTTAPNSHANFVASGTIDLNQFFKPKLNLSFRGKEIAYSNLSGDISVITDADLKITGRDTVIISGKLPLEEGLFQFEFQDFGGQNVSTPGKNAYTISISIRQNTYLKNSLLDVEIVGDIDLIKRSGEHSTLGGELSVNSGFFYYYSGVFDIDVGTITFDPVLYTITLDIQASTPVQDGTNRLIATLSGEIDKPVIVLSDENGLYTTQKELIQLLTTGYVQSTSGADALSGTAQNLVGAALEKEMERTASRISGFQRVDLKSQNSLLQTSSLDSITILVGKRLGKNVFVTYERSLNSNEPKQTVELEYRINRNISIIGAADDESVSASFRLRYQY